ncbi:MAG: ADP-ribosylglycohydrolase family protein [Tissierellia bacterium]|nr:ADP-ribosylglycohydrolase family protein [Tissierellia bacterium]
MKTLDRYKGCLVGGAAGDALGFAVEFYDRETLLKKYGKNGIENYELDAGLARISDDTQMTIFTACGLLNARLNFLETHKYDCYIESIRLAYLDWLKTQTQEYPVEDKNCWLLNQKALFTRRYPGFTCITALKQGGWGTFTRRINNSKGCGGIMRLAPMGLFFQDLDLKTLELIGAKSAALTHGHELGYMPCAFLVHVINLLAHKKQITLIGAIEDAKHKINIFFKESMHLTYMIDLIDKAIDLSKSNLDDVDAIDSLGCGWVAEETLAIAIYCSLKYPEDFNKALVASVNHKGDSDSTGCLTGNIMGAYLGYDAIADKYKEKLEFRDILIELSKDLFYFYNLDKASLKKDSCYRKKYIDKTFYI